MFIPDWLWFFVVVLAAMIFWKIYGARIATAMDRFDQRRIDADRQLIADARNPMAHFRRTLDAINDQTEPVKLVQGPDGLGRVATWKGDTFPDVQSAEDVRWAAVILQARSFYQDLDEDFGLRVAGPAPKSARDWDT
jgi:hypothetical protein